MKTISCISILILMTAIAASAQSVKKVKIEELTDYIRKSDHPIVVSFWATWCAPCVAELPYLQKAVAQHTKEGTELVLVSLDFKESYPAKIEKFIKSRGMAGSFFWLNETDADHFSPQIDSSWSGSIPCTLLLNKKTGYRKFFERQLTERQAYLEIDKLVKDQ